MDLERLALLGVVVILLVVAMVGLTAWAHRTFGVRISSSRLAWATVIGLLVELVFEWRFLWESAVPLIAQVVIQVAVALAVAMVVLVVSESVAPSGTLPSPLRWPGLVRQRAARGRRYGAIVGILSRHKLLPPAIPENPTERREHARSLRLALEEAGVTFVKLGQVLSTRPELLPAEHITELRRLQERVEPVPAADIRAAFADSTGRTVEDAFAEFDDVPLASASIAQVHHARLPDGRAVAVKIQRPGIVPVVERDLDIVRRLAASLEKSASGGTLGAVDLAEGFAANLREELDFTREARNLAAMAAELAAHDDGVVVPAFEAELTTPEVLVMEELAGKTLATPDLFTALTADDRRDIADRLYRSILAQILVDGVFHADPHPGNIMVLPDHTIAFLDLGSVGRLTKDDREGLQQVLHAVRAQDAGMLTDALLHVVDRSEGLDVDRLQRELGSFMLATTGPGTRADATMFTALTLVLARHDLRVPPNLAGAFRSIATLDGTLRMLDPDFDLISKGTDFADEELSRSFTPTRVAEMLKDEAIKAVPQLRALPRQLSLILGDLEHGRTTVNVRVFSDPGDRGFLEHLVNVVVLAAVGITLAVVATLLIVFSGFFALQLLGGVIGGIAAILIQRVVYRAMRPGG